MRLAGGCAALLTAGLLLAGCGGAGTIPTQSQPPPVQPPPNPTPTPQLSITTTTVPAAQVGTAYSTQLAAVNGTGTLTWTASGFPQGITLSSAGVLSGTATSPYCGPVIAVKVTDSSTPAQSATANLSFNAGGFTTAGVNPSLMQAQVGIYYHGSLSIDCATDPVTWTLVAGSLPPGISMTPEPGYDQQIEFPGTPRQAGTYNLTFQAQDANFQYQVSVPLFVVPPAITLSDGMMQVGVVGQVFDHIVSVSGGAPPYNFTVNSGALPAGLQLNAATGEITGTPQTAGLTQFSLLLTDVSNTGQFTIHKPDSILVTPAPLRSRNETIATATPIVPGTYYASLSPYTNTSGQAAPDQDYYVMTGVSGGETYEIGVGNESEVWDGTYNSPVDSSADPALEIVDANGNRLASCNDPVADSPASGAPYSAGAKNFTDACISHTASTAFSNNFVDLQTTSANQTFYIHVFDFNGRARPDFLYSLTVTKK